MRTDELAGALAEAITAGALEEYEQRGHVDPFVLALGEHVVVHVTPADGELRENLPMIVNLAAWATRSNYVIEVAEGWHRTYGPGDELPTKPLEHGQFEREADTDPRIHTAIVVTVFDVKRRRVAAHTLTTWTVDEHGHHHWEQRDTFYQVAGVLPDLICAALDDPPPFPPPRANDHDSITAALDVLVERGYAQGVLVESVDE